MFTRRVAHDMDPPNRMATSVSRFPAGHPHWVRRQFPLMCTPGTRRVADHTLKTWMCSSRALGVVEYLQECSENLTRV